MLSSIKYITFSFQATLPPYVCKISLRRYKILKLSVAFFLYFELQECGRASFKLLKHLSANYVISVLKR